MTYKELTSLESIFQAWDEFKKGKREKFDAQLFERHLEDNIFELHNLLKTKTYKHGVYKEFYVSDPKRRHIHKAGVKDRVVHHLLYNYLYGLFDKHFIYDSYSCRIDKGTHRAVKRSAGFIRQESKNYSSFCWILHLDIKKFFTNVDHEILFKLLKNKITDPDILWLLGEIIGSFSSKEGEKKGIPLGNLTSQIFSNIYLNKLDQFVKQTLKIKYYIRYADDFVLISQDKTFLYSCINTLKQFLEAELQLSIHPDKSICRKSSWGVDFLGYIILPHYVLPRMTTKRRMFRKLRDLWGKPEFKQSLASYLGYLNHASSYKIKQKLMVETI